jgi:hypothetical protein
MASREEHITRIFRPLLVFSYCLTGVQLEDIVCSETSEAQEWQRGTEKADPFLASIGKKLPMLIGKP